MDTIKMMTSKRQPASQQQTRKPTSQPLTLSSVGALLFICLSDVLYWMLMKNGSRGWALWKWVIGVNDDYILDLWNLSQMSKDKRYKIGKQRLREKKAVRVWVFDLFVYWICGCSKSTLSPPLFLEEHAGGGGQVDRSFSLKKNLKIYCVLCISICWPISVKIDLLTVVQTNICRGSGTMKSIPKKRWFRHSTPPILNF